MLHTLQAFAIAVTLVLTVATVYIVVRAVRSMVGVLGIGQPAIGRTDHPGRRWATMLKETFGHTRMFQWRWVGVMHWFVYFGFLILSTAVLQGIFQLFDPSFALPLIGRFFVYEWVCEAIGVLSTIGIVFLIVYRQTHKPSRLGRDSRFFGSSFWQAYFVEAMALLEGAAIIFIRGAEYGLDKAEGHTDSATRFHFPLSSYVGEWLHYPLGRDGLEALVIVIAVIKVVSALAWLDVVALNLTMGIAWHRFTAWPNIWFKRESVGRDTDGATTAVGAMKPLVSDGKPVTLDDLDDLDEDSKLGVGAISDFSWKGILDFTTCTECGRCQSQCPAWNTEKPLSPKLLVLGLRDHAYEAAPYLRSSDPAASEAAVLQRSLIGKADGDPSGTDVDDWFYNPEGGDFVIDEDVLWSCTSCGACVQQCPVDIEHVDHIMDMRRYQVLVESNFPTELNGLFKGLENKGNPWNMSPSARLDWAKDLPFDIKVVGEDLESLEEVDWLFWVGCAGAYEDRAKKTTRAVAELLDMAGVSFGVLGNGETCNGDPARRAGNEFVFQGLASANVETFKEYKVKKAVTTCAHCFNTLKNEYRQFGIELEVVHHTQLLNRLVREGRLTPVADGAGAHKRSITYHDPCYIGRHNGVYTPPRELLQILPGAEYVEMPRNSERSFCCGAGGARMWMEERIGQRINRNRTDEAVATGADQIAVGCPFCRVMLSDGLTAAQSDGSARESVEVLDVAQMLLASVKGEQATRLLPGEGAAVATKAEPQPGDATVTEDTITATEDTGPAAKASGGSSLFDTPAGEAPREAPAERAPDDASSLFDTPAPAEREAKEAPAEEPEKPEAKSSGGSLFDIGAEEPETPEAKSSGGSLFDLGAEEPEEPEKPEVKSSGGSLFDIAADEAERAAEPETEPEAAEPTADLGGGGSLFDIVADNLEEAKASPAEEPKANAEPATPSGTASTPQSDVDFDSLGSLFDIEAPESTVTSARTAAETPKAPEPEAEDTATEAAQAEAETEETPGPEPAAEATETDAEKTTEAEPAGDASGAETRSAGPEATEAEAAEPDEEPKRPAPVASGETHSPRTDVDIHEAGSLFDL